MNMIILHSQQMLCQQYEHGHTTLTTNVGCANNMNMFILHSKQMLC